MTDKPAESVMRPSAWQKCLKYPAGIGESKCGRDRDVAPMPRHTLGVGL